MNDTERLPGQNPNATTGVSENVQRARGRDPAADVIVPQGGNVWPGPPQPLPTLGDVSREGSQNNSGLLGGAAMPRGGSMSLGEQNAIQGGAPPDESSLSSGFSGGGVLSNSVPDPSVRFRTQHPDAGGSGSGGSGSGGGGNIVIPNGDGTSTVISPDGSVKTVKAAPK